MNRALILPAGVCLIAFAALLATVGPYGRASTAATKLGAARRLADRGSISTQAGAAFKVPNASDVLPLSDSDARKLVSTHADEYLRPWRQWETSPHRWYSRAAPRPIPTINVEIVMAPVTKGQSNSFLLGTIAIIMGARSQPVPCIVDRTTRRAWMSVDGQWLTEDEWLKKAPVP
jgi:hypothetical protein